MREDGTEGTTKLTTASVFLSLVRQLTFLDSIDQRTLTESADTTTDDTPETPTALLNRIQQHATNIVAEYSLTSGFRYHSVAGQELIHYP